MRTRNWTSVADDDTDTGPRRFDDRTRVELVLVKPNDDVPTTAMVAWRTWSLMDSEVVLTITLRGATFGNTVQINDFDVVGGRLR